MQAIYGLSIWNMYIHIYIYIIFRQSLSSQWYHSPKDYFQTNLMMYNEIEDNVVGFTYKSKTQLGLISVRWYNVNTHVRTKVLLWSSLNGYINHC